MAQQEASRPASSDPAPYIAALIALYGWAETSLLAHATGLLTRAPATLLGSRRVAERMRAAVLQVLAQLDARTPSLVAAVVDLEAGNGGRDGRALVSRRPGMPGSGKPGGNSGAGGTSGPPPHDPGSGIGLPEEPPFDLSLHHTERAAQAIRDDLTSELDDVRRRITRLPDDIYKAVAPQGAVLQVLNNGLTDEAVMAAHPGWTWTQVDAEMHRVHSITPAEAQAITWRRFVQRGVTGFTDRSGRDWQLSSYVEMAVRTAAARAYRDSHTQVMRAAGIRYFTIPPHSHACPECFPWQHTVLTDERDVSGFPTVDEAIAAGLFHPNCRCTLVPWFPNVTPEPAPADWGAAEQTAYRASQKQRALERETRKAKAGADHSLTPEARAAARKDVRRLQGRIRGHLAEHPTLTRQSRRERPHLGDDVMKLPPAPTPAGGPPPPPAPGSGRR